MKLSSIILLSIMFVGLISCGNVSDEYNNIVKEKNEHQIEYLEARFERLQELSEKIPFEEKVTKEEEKKQAKLASSYFNLSEEDDQEYKELMQSFNKKMEEIRKEHMKDMDPEKLKEILSTNVQTNKNSENVLIKIKRYYNAIRSIDHSTQLTSSEEKRTKAGDETKKAIEEYKDFTDEL